MFDFSVGNGCRRLIAPHSVASVRTSLPPQPSSTRWPRYQGNAVITWTEWPRSTSPSTIDVITSPVGATSGAK